MKKRKLLARVLPTVRAFLFEAVVIPLGILATIELVAAAFGSEPDMFGAAVLAGLLFFFFGVISLVRLATGTPRRPNYLSQGDHQIATTKRGQGTPYYGLVFHGPRTTPFGESGAAVWCPPSCPFWSERYDWLEAREGRREAREGRLKRTRLGLAAASLYAPIHRHGTHVATKDLERRIAKGRRKAERKQAQVAARLTAQKNLA